MGCKKGFEVTINNTKYHIVCELTYFKRVYVANVCMSIKVFVGSNEVSVEKLDEYAKEKIADFITNTINGQDTLYWDFEGENRHFKEKG